MTPRPAEHGTHHLDAVYDAVLFDMDGVVTNTAAIHAAAWKQLFDEVLRGLRIDLIQLRLQRKCIDQVWRQAIEQEQEIFFVGARATGAAQHQERRPAAFMCGADAE